MMHILFYTRLLLYLVAVAIPFFHPAIVVPYDLFGIGLWFVILPGVFFTSFYFSPPFLKIKYWLAINAGFLLVASLVFGGFSLETLSMIGIGSIAFVLTFLVFKTQGKGRVIAALELFFAGSLYYAFLSYSRSSQEIAAASSGFIKLLFVLAVVSFFVHAVVLFLASFPAVIVGKGKRNILIFLGFLAPVVLAIAFLIPADFIIHEVRLNPLSEELDRKTIPLDEESNSPFDGNLLNKWRRDREGRLEGLSPEQWKNLNLKRRSGSGGKQYAVMIVASRRDTLYLGDRYFGDLDPVRGLLFSEHEDINSLSSLRLIETWQNTTPLSEKARNEYTSLLLSTLADRFFAYRPLSFTPTILNNNYLPFVYSYEAEFDISDAGKEELAAAGELAQIERGEIESSLSIPFTAEQRVPFQQYVDSIITNKMSPYEKVFAILTGFSSFQYELGFDENVHIKKLVNFLTVTKTGDCTEFANTTVVLARVAGVPSRVVTGFLAAQGLQLPKHKRGLAYLQQKMEPLQKYSLSELMLVTTSHRHAWAQVYISGYGWIDLEPTEFAIPPKMGGDPNQWNLVIPLMEPVQEKAKLTPFPWATLVIVTLICLGGLVVLVYLYKFIRELVLVMLSKKNTLSGLKALHKLLLIRLIVLGYEYKPPSLTLTEYAEKYPVLKDFSALYNGIRYRERIEGEEKTMLWNSLCLEYIKITESLKAKRIHSLDFIKYIFSLKGLRY